MLAKEDIESISRVSAGTFFDAECDEHHRTFELARQALREPFERALNLVERCIRAGGKILLFGNGGSAADAQHLAAELVIRYKADRPAIAAIALTTDSSSITACANDLGFDVLFARQVEALAKPQDVAIGISTSGRSPNVLKGIEEARRIGATTIGLTGGAGGAMPGMCDTVLIVPSTVTARIQEMHILVGHMLCKALEQRLGLV